MIKNAISILLICSSIACVYSIDCKNGKFESGNCVCDNGYTGPDCSLHTCPKGESFSIYLSEAEGAKARQLESGEEKYQNSNMELIVAKSRILSISGIKVETIVTDSIKVGSISFYKVKFSSDLDLDKTGGVIKCTKSDKSSSVFKIVYGKSAKEKNTYYVEKDLTNDYYCIVISKRNDFSLLLKDVVTTETITCEVATGEKPPYKCTPDVTITGLGTLFTEMGIEKEITDGNIAFKKSDDNKIYRGTFTSEAGSDRRLLNDNSSRILAEGDLILTITSSEKIASVTITPYLLINSKLDKLSIENSEIGYYINDLGKDGLKLTKVEKVEFDSGKYIYKVSGVKYEGIEKNGGKLSCNDIYGNKFTGNIYSYNSNNYYIEYDNDKTDITTKLFTCEVISTENDLSLLLRNVEISNIKCATATGEKPPYTCTLTITGLGTLFTEMGIEKAITNGNIAFKKSDDNKIYTGTFTSELSDVRRLLNDNSSRILTGENLKLTITSSEKINTSTKITPYLLINSKLDKLSIENSELYENIQCDSNNENCELIKGETVEDNIITVKKDKIVIYINNVTNDDSFNVTVYKEAVELFNKYFREGLSLIDGNDNSVRIIEVKEIVSKRLLLEIKRLLLDGSVDYTITTKPSITTLSTAKIYSNYNTIHPEIECSGQGECDRTIGNCNCYDGFSGSACQRLECPNNCNGNGECMLVKDILKDIDGSNFSDNVYGCKCKEGYRGYDCSLSECPSGEDPEGTTGSNAEKRDCSGRGICDYTTGTCKCFKGYGGSDCSKK